MVLGKWDSYMQKDETGLFPSNTHENRLKMDEGPQCEKGIHQNREENTGSNLFDLSHSNFFLETLPKAREARAKMNYWDFIRFKSFCTAKETVNKTKRQLTEWEKIFANMSDKGLVSQIYKELTKLNAQRTNNPIKKWAEEVNRYFCKEDIQMANRHMEKCSSSLGIRDIQIKTTMRYHLTLVSRAKINKSGNERCW